MAKGKKKKKDLDFQKVKLKVGRRIKRNDRETKAEFSTRKIVLKEIRRYSDDPISALSRNSQHISHQGKLSLLSHFRGALKPEVVKSLNKPIQDSLAKFILDNSSDVRLSAIKCLKICFHHLKGDSTLIRDFVSSLKPYLDCAYTHVSKDLASDCHEFVKFLVDQNEWPTFEPLMAIMYGRLRAGELDDKHKAVALDLRRHHHRHNIQKELEAEEPHMEKLVWSSNNNLLNFDQFIHDAPEERDPKCEIQLGLIEQENDIVEEFLSLIKSLDHKLGHVEPKRLRRF